MAALGVQVLLDGDWLAQRLAEHDPVFDENVGIWVARFEKTAALDSTLEAGLRRMADHSELSGAYLRVVVAAAPTEATAMWQRCHDAALANQWEPICTVVISGGRASSPAGSADFLCIEVPERAGGVPQSQSDRQWMLFNWLSFLADLCRGSDGVRAWTEWLGQVAPARAAGLSVRQDHILGLIDRASFQPRTILRRLAEGMAGQIANTLADRSIFALDANAHAFIQGGVEVAPKLPGFVQQLAETTASAVCGSDSEGFEASAAERRRVAAEKQLPAEIARQIRGAVATIRETEWAWRGAFRKVVDDQLRRGLTAALPALQERLETELAKAALEPPPNSASMAAPRLPDLSPVAAAHVAWENAHESTEPVAAGLLALTSWMCVLLGLAFMGAAKAVEVGLAPVSSRPIAPGDAGQASWLGTHILSVGFNVGALIGAIVVASVYMWRKRRAQVALHERDEDLTAAIQDWGEAAARGLGKIASELLGRHLAMSREFRKETIKAELARIKCVTSALRRNADTLGVPVADRYDAVLPKEFYAAAQQTAEIADVQKHLQGQLELSSWRHKLDLMDAATLLDLCRSKYGDFGDGLVLDRHPQLAPYVTAAVNTIAVDLQMRVMRRLAAGGQGIWFLAAPGDAPVTASSFGRALRIQTKESIYVAFIRSAHGTSP